MDERLPSWRPGPTRDVLLSFLDEVVVVPPEQRVACFDNDGTLWCERPSYVQLDFFLWVLKDRVAADPRVAETPELAALLSGDRAAVAELGLPRIAMALTGLCAGLTPEAFTALVRAFMDGARTRRSTVRPAPPSTSRCSSCSTSCARSTSRPAW